MPTLNLRILSEDIEITTDLDASMHDAFREFRELVRPGESFGGLSYDELRDIALSRGRMDADELRV